MQLEAGGGYLYNKGQKDNDLKNSFYQLYLQAALALAPKVHLIPEIGYIDYGKNEAGGGAPASNLGDLWYLGAKWQIDF